MPKHLIFIDSNVLLDFYRARKESGLKLLRKVDDIHDRLISSYQVEMEFKCNRQSAIHESLGKLSAIRKLEHAAFLAESRVAGALSKRVAESNRHITQLRTRLKKVLTNPTSHDPVYKVVQRLFTNKSPLNLRRDMPARRDVKRRAFRRFMLGYPPRKQADVSMGDAFNWEWLVRVAQDTGDHVVIVTRDHDYGHDMDNTPVLNDWLLQEFRDRVGKNRQLVLTNLLSAALKRARVPVSKEAVKAEEIALREDYMEAPPYLSPVARSGSAAIEASMVQLAGQVSASIQRSFGILAEPGAYRWDVKDADLRVDK